MGAAADGIARTRARARTWPLTDVGREGIADVKSQQASQSECSPWPAPLLMALGVMRTIEVSANTITLRFDWMNGLRTVHWISRNILPVLRRARRDIRLDAGTARRL